MRALCGAIITAGALIGIGLSALGIGTRYSLDHRPVMTADGKPVTTADGEPALVKLSQMDRPLIFSLVFLTGAAVIGMGITFVGLAYHHVRREREYLWEKERHTVDRHRPAV